MAINARRAGESIPYVSPRDGVTRMSYVPKVVVRRHSFMTGGMMRHGSWKQEKCLVDNRTYGKSTPKPVTVRRAGKVIAVVVP